MGGTALRVHRTWQAPLTGMAANDPIQLCFSENRYNTVEFKSRRTVWTLSTKVVASPVATGTDRLSFGSSQEFPT